MNLRLDPGREKALADEARRTHRSQAEVIRDALDAYLDDDRARSRRHFSALVEEGTVLPTQDRTYRRSSLRLTAPTADDWADLREDRV